jgi:hypothetical protein
MDFYEEASLVMVPSGYKDQKVYSSVPDDGSGDLTFSRASSATRVGPDELIEKVRTNVTTYSQDFTNWTKSNVTITTSATANPLDGSLDSQDITPTATLGVHRVLKTNSGGLNSINTWSVYAKAKGYNFLFLVENGNTGSNVSFNLSTGEVGQENSAVGQIESLGSGWYRCSMIVTTTTTPRFDIYVSPTDSLSAYTADGTSGVTLFGAQAEVSDFGPTPYIATTSAAVSVGPVANLPRLDYLDSSSPRLLLEPQRTNLVQYSESFNTSSSWSLSRTSAFGSGSVANAVTSPDGYTNAEYIQQATGETDGGGCFQGISYTSGTTYTLSVFAKQGENRYARIGFGIGSGGAGIFCGFDLQDGIAGTPDTGVTAKIENYGNGWYRCSITATAQITGARNTFVYQSSNLNTFVTTPLQGIYVYGAQLEASASYATSYIPTLGAAVTRVADAASKTSASAIIGQTEGTVYSEFVVNGFANFGTPLCINNGTTDESVWLTTFANGDIRAEVFSSTGGGIQASFTKSGNVVGQTYKIAIGYAVNNFAFFVNGVQVGTTDTSGQVPVGMNRVDFDYANPATFVKSALEIKQALLFETRLSNADLATLTTL